MKWCAGCRTLRDGKLRRKKHNFQERFYERQMEDSDSANESVGSVADLRG